MTSLQSAASKPAATPGASSEQSPAQTEQVARRHGRAIEIRDSNAKPIPGAKVTLTNRNTKKVIELAGDHEGRVDLSGVPHAEYDILVSRADYAAAHRYDVSLPSNYTIVMDATTWMGTVVIEEDSVDKSKSPFRHFWNRLKTWL
jgi:hypothetical protein